MAAEEYIDLFELAQKNKSSKQAFLIDVVGSKKLKDYASSFYPIVQEITNILKNKNNILINNNFNEIMELGKNTNRVDQTTLNPMVLGDCACFFVNANSISKVEFINLVKHLMTKHKVNYDIHFQSCYYETDNYVDGGTKLYKGYVPRLLENLDKKNPNRTIISVQKNNEMGR